ncbi:MAG: hypothetical protein Q9160_002833 [Pyrenula sp. 1 TL-2023]
MASISQQKFSSLGLTTNTTETEPGCRIVSYTHDAGPDKPVMTLIHGYPQSAYIWRCRTPLSLETRLTIFPVNANVQQRRSPSPTRPPPNGPFPFRSTHPAPSPISLPSTSPPTHPSPPLQLPGYGISPPLASPPSPSHLTTGLHLLRALSALFPGPHPLILSGHDRGARICHRLAVALSSPPPTSSPTTEDSKTAAGLAKYLTLTSCIFMDIIPTLTQWTCFSTAAKAVRYFHWPFLASPSAPDIILSYGGGRWCREALARLQGTNEAGRARFSADGAWDVYSGLFEREKTVRGSCRDYEVGAEGECREQEGERDKGRRVRVRTLVVFSERGLGGMGDVRGIWREWVDGGSELKAVGMGGGFGHYLPEECPREVVGAMEGWLG